MREGEKDCLGTQSAGRRIMNFNGIIRRFSLGAGWMCKRKWFVFVSCCFMSNCLRVEKRNGEILCRPKIKLPFNLLALEHSIG